VTTNDSDVHSIHIKFLILSNKGICAHNIEGGDAEKVLWVVDFVLLQDCKDQRDSELYESRLREVEDRLSDFEQTVRCDEFGSNYLQRKLVRLN
jgi:hypothetical protein